MNALSAIEFMDWFEGTTMVKVCACWTLANGSVMSPTEAAKLLDEKVVGEHGRSYSEHPRTPLDTRTGYAVFRADIDGSEVVPVVHDGQDAATIEEVENACDFVCFVECHTACDDDA